MCRQELRLSPTGIVARSALALHKGKMVEVLAEGNFKIGGWVETVGPVTATIRSLGGEARRVDYDEVLEIKGVEGWPRKGES